MKKTIWGILLILTLVLSSACSTPGPAPAPVENTPAPKVGTPTPISNLPEQVQPTQPPERGRFDPETFADALGDYVLRPQDLPNDYKVPVNGEKRISNLGVIQEMGEVAGKHYIVTTGRVDGWYLQLERKKKEDIAPGGMESSIELFDSSKGAELALSPDWFKAYKSETKSPTWVDKGCNFGDQCLFYYYKSLDPATNLTKLEYDVAFSYKNVVVWVMGRGLDIDVTPDYVLNAAKALYSRLEAAS
jgi:hypothetical protein